MKTEWIEDFFALIEAGTFSKAAELRHVTQPAFSRRIRQLEEWLDVELIDRRSAQLSLTAHAQAYEASMRDWLTNLYAMRSRMRADATRGPRLIFTAQHTLATSYLPRLLSYFLSHAPETRLQVRASDRNNCIGMFQQGAADFLLCSELEGSPLYTSGVGLERITLGMEKLIPVCAANRHGQPLFNLESDSQLPLIGYDSDSFFGSALAVPYQLSLQHKYDVKLVCKTSFAIGVRELTLAGLGISWLPHALIKNDIETGRLKSLLGLLDGPTLINACYRHSSEDHSRTNKIWQLLNSNPPMV